jgi:hypothetical protein
MTNFVRHRAAEQQARIDAGAIGMVANAIRVDGGERPAAALRIDQRAPELQGPWACPDYRRFACLIDLVVRADARMPTDHGALSWRSTRPL